MRLVRRFPGEPASVAAARRAAAELLAEAGDELREVTQLLISELATNCVRHVGASFELTMAFDGSTVHVEVRDEADGRPAMRSPAARDERGRGLRVVDFLATRWGVRYDADAGKTVWFTLTGRSRPAEAASPA